MTTLNRPETTEEAQVSLVVETTEAQTGLVMKTTEAETGIMVKTTEAETGLVGLYALLIIPCVVLIIFGILCHRRYGCVCNK